MQPDNAPQETVPTIERSPAMLKGPYVPPQEPPKPNRRQRRAQASKARAKSNKAGRGRAPAPGPAPVKHKETSSNMTDENKQAEKAAEPTPREEKLEVVYEEPTITLPDSGLEVTVKGLRYKNFAIIGRVFGPLVSQISTMVKAKMDEDGNPVLDEDGKMVADEESIDEAEVMQTVLTSSMRDPEGVWLMEHVMTGLDIATIQDLTIQDGSLLLKACAGKVRRDDITSFFQANAALAGTTAGTG